MQEATDWDLWNAGLIGGPEPRGRRSPDELAAMKGERARNFAVACTNLNERWEAQHGTPPSTRPLERVHGRSRLPIPFA